MAERVGCLECGAEVAVRKDGSLYAHKDDGGQCPGSGMPGGVSGTVGLGKGDPYEDTPGADDGAAGAVSPAGGFVWRCTVVVPCPYLDDAAWHRANGGAAEKAAHDAGHNPTGEAHHIDTAPSLDGHHLVLTYRVPV